MENKLLKHIQLQIERLGGVTGQSSENEFHGVTLSKTMKSFFNTKWNPNYTYEYYGSSPDEIELIFEPEYIDRELIASEPSIRFISLGYDEITQYLVVTPLYCVAMQDPPVYKIDPKGQNRLTHPLSFVEIINRLEICQNIPQNQIFDDSISFEDDNLANAIRKELHNIHGKVSLEEIKKIDKLLLVDYNIYSLKGIEIFENLTEIIIDENNIESLDPLIEIERISFISAVNNNIHDAKRIIDSKPECTIYLLNNPCSDDE